MATKKLETKLETINARIAALQAQAETVRKREVSAVVAKIKDAIARYGLTAADLGLVVLGRKAVEAPQSTKPERKVARKAAKAAHAAKTTRAAKYTDGQGRTWGGVGKRPGWFKAELASGKLPEDLLVTE
jgi:DNA-binding protein H-NS